MSTFLETSEAKVLAPAWTYPGSYGRLSESLVVAGDKLIGVVDSIVFAVDIYTGEPASGTDGDWRYELASSSASPQIASGGGVVYLMDGKKLVALRLADAAPLAKWKTPQLHQVSALLAKGDDLIAVSIERQSGATQVSGFAASTGAQKFGPLKVSQSSPGPVGYGDDAVFFVADGVLNAINVSHGDPRWRFPAAGEAMETLEELAAPLVAGDTVLVCGQALYGVSLTLGKQLFKIGATAGDVQWHLPAADIPTTVHAATKTVNLKATRPHAGASHLLQSAQPTAAAAKAGTAVATNSVGDVVCFSLADGSVSWRHKVHAPGAPVIIDGVVYVTIDNCARLMRFDYASGTPLGAPYSLPNLAPSQPAVIANGALFLAGDDGSIVSRPFAKQSAAHFNGSDAMICVKADGAQFDFDEFTIEAWIRSSTGGEILSSHPTSDDEAYGFRLNLTSEGQIRVAIFNEKTHGLHLGRTAATRAADGQWHHIALTRDKTGFKVLLDGEWLEVFLAPGDRAAELPIGGHSALTIGAFVPAAAIAPTDFFRGLMREIRIWDRVLDTGSINNNLRATLAGAEPRLRGLWRLDDGAADKPHNAASGHRVQADFKHAGWQPTDLTMDRSAFPYLLHETTTQWPYAGTWAARGESYVVGSPAISSDNVIAFGTPNVIYAVDAHDGKRIWSMDVAGRASDPVRHGEGFLVLTEDESLLYIDARSGAKVQLPAFSDMRHDHGAALAAPAVGISHMAVAGGAGKSEVMLWDHAAPQARALTLPGTPLHLAFGDAGLMVMTEGDAGYTLHLIDAAAHKLLGSRPVATAACCPAGNWVFAVSDGRVIKLDGLNITAAPLATSVAIAGGVTGMVALGNEDLLIAATADGNVYGMTLSTLSLNWNTTLPAGKAKGSRAVNPPTLHPDGHLVCTTADGVVAILDGDSGALLGHYLLENGAIGAPLMSHGTLYTGCKDTISYANAMLRSNALDYDLDGALHSIVVGETMALRLNLDLAGAPIAAGKQHAVVEASDEAATLHLLEVHESCVEAWINVPSIKTASSARVGGGILGIAPTVESGFDINMWLDADGTLHYSSRARDADVWSGLHVSAATGLVDGKWHHIAASRSPAPRTASAGSPDRVVIYVDGVAIATQSETAPAAPKKSISGLKAYIGATMDDELAAARPFCGMIAEVRVWDTYLIASEITERRGVKLRGDEPDLLAYWNFDYSAIHDSALQGHEGVLAQAPDKKAPVWWLVDLPFTRPSYAYITNTAAIQSQTEGMTTYSLDLKVCAADGTGIAGERVNLWYVRRHKDDPAHISINNTEVQCVESGQEPDPVKLLKDAAKVFEAITGSDGVLHLTVMSPQSGHGPSLDMWTQFMPVNERFHVNVLIDNQKLAKPAPPSLTAQAKLIQDYHYKTGNVVDHTRDRSTWRVVLRARTADGTPRIREPITLWSAQPVTIEVDHVSYRINSENFTTLPADFNGELTVVMAAEELTAPVLYARAGFMHRNDRVVINADEDTHAQLTDLKESDLTTPRVTNWKKNKPGEKEEKAAMLEPGYATHAPNIAKAVRQVTAVAKPSDKRALLRAGRMSPARRRLIAMRAEQGDPECGKLLAAGNNASYMPTIRAMRQPQVVVPSDRVAARRTLHGMTCNAAVNPDAFLEALDDGALGFVFEHTGNGAPVYRSLHTQAEVDEARGVATQVLRTPLLGWFWEDAWDAVVDAANDIYDAATKIVITITDTVNLAISTIDGVIHKVVDSIADALDAVAGFFKQLMVGIMKVIAFLRALFDWGKIIETQRILHQIMRTVFESSRKAIRDQAKLGKVLKALDAAPRGAVSSHESFNQVSKKSGDNKSQIVSSADSVQSKSILQKSGGTSTSTAASGGDVGPVPDPKNSLNLNDSALQGIPAMIGNLLDLTPATMVSQIEAMLKKAGSGDLSSLLSGVSTLAADFSGVTDTFLALLDTTINIPFVSELYKWVTGEELSILSLLCLGLAVMVNIAYAVATLLTGDVRSFADDAKGLPAQLRRASGLEPAYHAGKLAAGDGLPETSRALETLLCVFRSLTIVSDVIADIVYYEYRTTESMKYKKILSVVKIFQGIFGVTACALQLFGSQMRYWERIKHVAGPDAEKFLPPFEWVPYVVFSIQALLRLVKIGAGVYGLLSPGEFSGTKFSKLDKCEYLVSRIVSYAGLWLIIMQVMQLLELKAKLEEKGNYNVTKEYELFAIRDIMGMVPLLAEWMYTDMGMNAIQPRAPGIEAASGMYMVLAVVRGAANASALGLHCAAVYGYGDMD